MKAKFILLAIALLLQQSIYAQIFTTVIDETALQFRVKQIDEFFTRFNYETDYKGEHPANPSDKEEQKKNMLTLFNLDRFSNEKHQVDSVVSNFIDYVIDNKVKIHYEDSTWNAEAKSSFVYEGKKYDVVFTLKPERIKGVMFKWVIIDIQSPLFAQFPKEPKDTITISPAEHGISFMTLPETINLNKMSVGTTYAKGYHRSTLPVFDYLAASGKIKINAVTKVVYHFHLKDANFDVERIEKEDSYNQGWLINKLDFRKEANDEK